ncbi:MAG: carbohydrate ABC transporter permease [Candidatus Dormibacter sp.]|uniref:carbohydrate ABC transporter permease n=1 Tax=Candidatus Dormibacter sp. TaxID=2973982 RepID=UPI0026B912B8
MATATTPELTVTTRPEPVQTPEQGERGWLRWVRLIPLFIGALVFILPFYYMVVSALQKDPNPNISGAFPNPNKLSLDNLININNAINLPQTLLNSGLFTGGVLLATLIFGVLAGYALAQLHFRGRQVVFYTMILLLVMPFQLLIIPLYVLIARNFGLADTLVGMILPFAINPTAVFIFRQFFLQLPKDMFEAARIDGASELTILTRVVLPLTRPALLTALLITFIGPWNEFLWPFLITKKLSLQPLAVALANFISTSAQRGPNPYGAILAGATVLAVPVIILFLIFQRRFVESSIGSAVKG